MAPHWTQIQELGEEGGPRMAFSGGRLKENSPGKLRTHGSRDSRRHGKHVLQPSPPLRPRTVHSPISTRLSWSKIFLGHFLWKPKSKVPSKVMLDLSYKATQATPTSLPVWSAHYCLCMLEEGTITVNLPLIFKSDLDQLRLTQSSQEPLGFFFLKGSSLFKMVWQAS